MSDSFIICTVGAILLLSLVAIGVYDIRRFIMGERAKSKEDENSRLEMVDYCTKDVKATEKLFASVEEDFRDFQNGPDNR